MGVSPGSSTGTGSRNGSRTGSGRGQEIGELVLDGFRADPERVSAAFESELTRLVRLHGVPLAADGPLAMDALSGLPPLPAGLSARRLGQELARAVHGGLSGHGEVTR